MVQSRKEIWQRGGLTLVVEKEAKVGACCMSLVFNAAFDLKKSPVFVRVLMTSNRLKLVARLAANKAPHSVPSGDAWHQDAQVIVRPWQTRE